MVTLGVGIGVVRAGAAGAQTGPQPTVPAPTSQLRLTQQTTWVVDNGTFQLGLSVTTPDPGSARIQLSVYQPLGSRSDFNESLADRIHTGRMNVFDPVPLTSLGANPQLSVAVNPKSTARTGMSVHLTASGVYPVRVDLVDGAGNSLARLTTHIVYSGADAGSGRLEVAWVAPLHAPPATGSSGVPTDAAAGLTTLSSQLATHPNLSLTVDATPQTIEGLASGTAAERAAVAQLAQSMTAGTRELVGASYVRLDLPAMLNAGLESEVGPQLTTGTTTLSSSLHAAPAAGTWIESGPLSGAAVDALAGQGVQRLVTADNTLTPLPAAETARTPAQPFSVLGKTSHVAGAAVDAGLSSFFTPHADQLLAAHQLLADLAIVQLELPNRKGGRGVVIVPPTGWKPETTFLETFLDGLDSAPMLSPVTIDRLFSDVTPLQTGTRPLVRSVAGADQQPKSQPIGDAAAIRAARRPVASLASLVPANSPTLAEIGRHILTSESADLTDRARPAQLAMANSLIDRLKSMVRLPGNQSITLTARQGLIPITILSSAPYPVRVRMEMTSQKLGFRALGPPGIDCTQSGTSETCTVDLKAQNTTVRVPVLAKTAGVFSLTVALDSPDGALTLATNQDTVRSTAASGVGVFLSLGAALLLAVWWVRNVVHGRRARQLVPKGAGESDGPARGVVTRAGVVARVRPATPAPRSGPVRPEPVVKPVAAPGPLPDFRPRGSRPARTA